MIVSAEQFWRNTKRLEKVRTESVKNVRTIKSSYSVTAYTWYIIATRM